jgi:CubicO group peptidase (beta-lactamase class C family)
MRSRIHLSSLCVALTAATASAGADSIDDFVKSEMAKRQIPGVSIAVIRDGRLVKSQGYGLANIELKAPATVESVYQLASVSKQFTAAAILLLAQDGKLAIEDKIHKHLPDLPQAWNEVTVRHLLDHTSGIKSYTRIPDFFTTARKDYTHREIIKLVADSPMEFKPGDKWVYNNTGYFLLGMIVENVSGKSFGDFLEERVFKPLGMNSTRMNDFKAIIPNRAHGYSAAGGKLVNGEYVSPTQPYSAGALVSTVADMAKWDAALNSEGLLPRSIRERMWTEAKINDGKGAGYGFGWAVGNRNGRKLVEHGGGIQGFSTHIARFLEDRLSVIVLTNSDNGRAGTIANGIAGLTIPFLKVAELKPIPDKDAETTSLLRKAFISLIAAKPEEAPLTDSFRAFLTPDRLKAGSAQIAGQGPLKTFELLKTQKQDKLTIYEYRAGFQSSRYLVSFMLTEDKKIAGANVQPD